jgi:PAS domain S-box-containing protein
MRFTRDLLITVLSVAIASAIRVLLEPVLSDRAAFQLYTLAVMVSAWVGGRWSGLAATALATVVGIWLFVEPFSVAQVRDARGIAQILLFAGTGVAISFLAGQLHDSRLAAESEARNAKQVSDELSGLLESMREGFEALDRNFRVTYINSAAQRIIGRPAADMTGREIWGEFPANIGPQVEAQLRDVMAQRMPASSDQFHDASGRWFAINAYPFRDGVSILFRDISGRKEAEEERERLIGELRDALAKVHTLRGLIPICASCKKIRNDKGYWEQLEVYLREHSDAGFTHGMCPECAAKFWEG